MIRFVRGAAIALITIGSLASAASFDCAVAKSATEKLICGDPALSKLDEALARAFRNASANPADRNFVKAWQKLWLATRETCGDVECMKPAYVTQISELGERAERSAGGAVPTGISGVYERFVNGQRDIHTSRLTLVELKADRVRVMGGAIRVSNPATGAVNVGEINGPGFVAGNNIAYQEPGYAECRFVITLVEKGLKVGDDGMNCGGHNVTFSGDYRKAVSQ